MKRIFLLLVLVLFLSGCYGSAVVLFDDVEVNVMVADTPDKRALGLTVVDSLDEYEGMLFVFDEEKYPSFWMKDMNFPIDMIFVSEDGEVVGIEKDLQPCTEECLTYGSYFPAKYVVEVNSGFAQEHNIKFGDNVSINF